MAKYRIDTDQGAFMVETDDAPQDPRQFAPQNLDKPGLPDSRTMPTPKNFPGFGNPAAEYAKRQEPVNRMLDGAARMTRAGADAKFGGAADIMRGAGEIALPLAAVPLAGAGSLGAGAAMLGRMALGAGGGYAGGQVARSMVPEDQPGLQDFVENAGATAGGLLAGGASESPKIGAFIKGAAREVPKKLPSAMLAGAAGHAIGRPGTMAILEALYAGPSIIRGAMAEAAGKPWLGAGASRLFGVNKPLPTPAPNPQGVAARQEGIRLRGLMDAPKAPAPPAPTPPIPTPTELPSGRKPGGIWNQDKAPTDAEIIAADAKSKANIEALKARQAAKQNPRPTPPPPPTPKPTAPSENMASRMAAQDAAGQQRTGLMNDVVAEAEKRGAWYETSGKIGEKLTDTKQTALIKFAAEKGKPMERFTESEYNALVKEFNATKPLHPTDGAPWRLELAGANYKPGKKLGRDVETTLRHFNNMRLGKE